MPMRHVWLGDVEQNSCCWLKRSQKIAADSGSWNRYVGRKRSVLHPEQIRDWV